jgi:hypothetical protein
LKRRQANLQSHLPNGKSHFANGKDAKASLQSDKAREQRHVSAGKMTNQICKMAGIKIKALKTTGFSPASGR